MNRLFLIAVCCLFLGTTAYSQLGNQNTYLLRNLDNYSSYSAIWGYVAPNGREYAILGTNTGTSFVDITDSANIHQVDFVSGVNSSWREMKTYSHYAYVVSEGTNSGLQIMDLQYLPDSVSLVNTWFYSGYTKTHSISQSGPYLYLNGGNASPNGGVAVVSVVNPTAPVKLGQWTTEYVHDCRVLNDTIWTANVYSGRMSIINAANKSSLQFVDNWQAYNTQVVSTHNAAITDDRSHIFTTNEISSPPGRLYAYDIQDLDNITRVSEWQPTGITSSIVHNVEIYGKYAVLAHYSSGIRIVNISNPAAPVEAAWYDTYPSSNSASFNGCWGVYVFPTGKIVGSDISNGLFVIKTTFSMRDCEGFTNTAFPPTFYELDYSGTQYWSRQNVSAYGTGSGSAKFDFFNAPAGTTQSIFTNCAPTKAGTYLTFDEAYAPYSASFPGPDSLYVESSTNGGVSFTILAALAGLHPSGGELNTAPATASAFTPNSSHWRSKIYSLPVGTNKVRLRARSGFANNLYIDNICIQPLASPVVNTAGLMNQGMFINSSPYWRLEDTVSFYLRKNLAPYILVDSARSVISGSPFMNNVLFNRALTGNYYLAVKHRNSIETWSSVPISYTRGGTFSKNFIDPGASYGDNMVQLIQTENWRGIFSGDVNQDGTVDASDVSIIDNDAANFAGGYIVTDLTGDNFVDGSDFAFADNNASNFIAAVKPPGANLIPPTIQSDQAPPVFENEMQRQKYEEGKREAAEQKVVAQPKKQTYKEYLEMKRNENMNKSLK
ncbi:MAG: choice-of-anchor B family protein [Ignavibacteria bacterium]|nr:choice-of-anchor B family protein [Ignavibacteria bacterium]